MISPAEILTLLKNYLPRLTGLFSDKTAVSAEIVVGTPQILRITFPNHGFITNQEIGLVDALIDNPIVGVTQFTNPDSLRYETNTQHDLTLGYIDNQTNGEIELRGFTDSQFNGFFPLEDVVSKTLFEILHDNLPTLNGNEVLREKWENGINGIFQISNIIDINIFDILLTNKPVFSTGAIPQLSVVTSYRMSTASDFDRAQELYTKMDTDKLWLYVIMNDANTSKDRQIDSDANQSKTAQDDQRMRVINTWAVDVFFPTKNDLGGANAVQLAWNDVLVYMIAVLAGINFETFGNSNFISSFLSHGSIVYNRAYYGHAYEFEYVYDITNVQTFTTQFIETRAFREDDISFAEIQDGSNIILDSEE